MHCSFWSHSFPLIFYILLSSVTGIYVDKTLTFRPDGTFKIVQFTDLHFGEDPVKDLNSTIVQARILKEEKPDLVIMTGDSVSGYAWNGTTQGWFAERWAQLTSPMMNLHYRWAFAIGNHDDEADLDREQIIALDRSYPLSLTEFGPTSIHGASNYVLPVLSNDRSKTLVNLWFFDSGDENCLTVPGWGCVYPDQVEWYRDLASSQQNSLGKIIPGLSFFHIPVPEFMNVWNYETTYGRLQDVGVCCFSLNTGLFSAMREMGDMRAVFCGHDHDNDFFGDYYNITLAYGRKTGYGGYGPPPGWLRGARIIHMKQDPFKITTWIRQEDGTAVYVQPTHHAGTNQTFLCCDALGKESRERDFR